MRGLAALCLAACVAGCDVGGPPPGVIESCTSDLALPPGVSTDILFVIDDSQSMTEEQAKVVDELGTFVSALLEGPIRNDFQVGVVTTSVTSNAMACGVGAVPELYRYDEKSGRLQPGKDETGRPLEPPGPRILAWDDPDFLSAFSTLVTQGIHGSGQEMGLEAMRLALTPPLVSQGGVEGNAGFLRPGSRLLVIIVSDEDDCSDPSGTALVLQPPCEDVSCGDDGDCGAEGSYCLEGLTGGGRQCQPNACETAAGRALLEPVQTYVDFLRNLDDGTGSGRRRETFLAVIGAVGTDADHSPERCRGDGDEAQGIAVRYREAVEQMGESGYIDSICSDDYGTALQAIAEMVNAPQVLELEQSPLDGRLLQIEIDRAGGGTDRCTLGDGFSYEPATATSRARVTLEGACRLHHGDHIRIELICAG